MLSRPCPFCGESGAERFREHEDGRVEFAGLRVRVDDFEWSVSCRSCGARGPKVTLDDIQKDFRSHDSDLPAEHLARIDALGAKLARERWNTMVPTSSPA